MGKRKTLEIQFDSRIMCIARYIMYTCRRICARVSLVHPLFERDVGAILRKILINYARAIDPLKFLCESEPTRR